MTLGNISNIITGPFGSQLHQSDYVPVGIACIMPQNIGNRTLNKDGIARITKKDAERLSRYAVRVDDIVYARRGDVEKHAYISSEDDGALCGTGCMRVRVDSEKAYPLYVSFYLNRPESKRWISQHAVGSNMPNLNTEILNNVPIELPAMAEQKIISHFLENIDRKIQLNVQICAEMEATAKTLYDYWFVQFDFPDENGRPYRASGGEMVWNEQSKRKIPKGWTVGKLCDIANITMGQSPAGESYNEMSEGTIFYQGRTDFGLRFPTPRMYTTAPTRFAKKGDILLSVRAPVGDLNIAMENCCIGRGLAALNSKIGSQMHLFYTLAGFKQLFDIMDGNGTTFGSITKDILFDMSVVIPTNPLLCEFEKHIKPIETKIQVCEQENRELIKLRDWLLPMLMNGQARVE